MVTALTVKSEGYNKKQLLYSLKLVIITMHNLTVCYNIPFTYT